MPANRVKIGQRVVGALEPGESVYDTAVVGFGARRQKGAAVSYFVFYRTAEGRQRWHTIGRHGAPWTPDEARKEARRVLGEVAKGEDPAAERKRKRLAPSVADLCDLYLREAEAGRLLTRRGAAKKPSTVATDRSRINAHIKPLMGAMKVEAVTRRDVERLQVAVAEGKTHKRTKLAKPRALANVRAGKGGASRTVATLGAVFAFAVSEGFRTDNPTHGVRLYATNTRDRRLSPAEYAALGAALRRLDGAMWPDALACVRFLVLTGWRRGEAIGLRWGDLDLERRTARLRDTKTGASMRPLSRRACDLLRVLHRAGDGHVFRPARGGDRAVLSLPGYWKRIVGEADLPSEITAHTLRHSFASVAADGGASELTIASLLGHAKGSVTSRYVHSADAVLLEAADRVADAIAEMMDAQPASLPEAAE